LRGAIQDGRKAKGRERRAAQIETAPLRPRSIGGGNVERGHGERHADRQIDVEDRAPISHFGQDAAQEDTDRGAGAADRPPGAECLGALLALEGGGDDREGSGREHRSTQALTGTCGKEHGRAQ
jgi:hypothetical protein